MFYDNYIKLCKSVGKTPSAVAIEVGIGKSNVTYWKSGRNKPTDLTLQKLADYFGVSADYLKGEEAQKNIPAVQSDNEDSTTKELLDIIQNGTDEDRQTLLEMYQLLKRREKR